DAPALRSADVGVAMGIAGTAAAKEAADVVLLDDNFATLAAAVEEGRRVFDNIVKALAFVLPTNLGEATIVFVAVLCFPTLDGSPLTPILPIQILWINLAATVTLALPLAFEGLEPDVMRRPPRRPGASPFTRRVMRRTLMMTVLLALAGIGMFFCEYTQQIRSGVDPQTAETLAQTAAATTVVVFQILYLLVCRSLTLSSWQVNPWSNRWVYAGIGGIIVLQGLFIYLPAMNHLFETAPLEPSAYLRIFLAALPATIAVSVEKWLYRRSNPPDADFS
ncbi:MAG: cation transporting ATPase C-terminal domain-containing protein, partial [Planctomycetia bacterium]